MFVNAASIELTRTDVITSKRHPWFSPVFNAALSQGFYSPRVNAKSAYFLDKLGLAALPSLHTSRQPHYGALEALNGGEIWSVKRKSRQYFLLFNFPADVCLEEPQTYNNKGVSRK